VTALPCCSCSDPHPHPIATRRTYDNRLVELDSDGARWVNGQRTPDLGAGPVRSADALDRARAVGWLVMSNACILEAAEVSDLYLRGRALPRAPGTMRDLQAALEPKRTAPVLLVWTVLSADSRGKPTERQARLPRMKWPGLVLFDFCGGPGSARGRYRLFRQLPTPRNGAHDVACEDTGFAFRRLADLWKHLEAS
jgi:hypothetical protein